MQLSGMPAHINRSGLSQTRKSRCGSVELPGTEFAECVAGSHLVADMDTHTCGEPRLLGAFTQGYGEVTECAR